MARILVICVGNEFRQDDRAAWLVADRIPATEGVRVEKHSGDGTGLMDLWQGFEGKVIVVDATQSGSGAGTIHWWPSVAQLPVEGGFRCSSHQFGVLQAIAMSKELQQLPDKFSVLGIEGEHFQFGLDLSPAVEAALPKVLEKLQEEIAHA